jgi:PTH1 family peptidyl-tRNA hydrolase
MRLAALTALATLGRSSMVKVASTKPPPHAAVAAAARSLATAANPLESAIAKVQKQQAKREQKLAKKLQKQQQKQQKQQQQPDELRQQPVPASRPEQLVLVCLGNVGDKYTMTRHNVGFLVADVLAERWQLQFAQQRSLQALVASGTVGDLGASRTIHIVKPTTMMNLSGESVRRVLAAQSLPRSAVLVVVDDVAIPFGALRMRLKGSAGGHNGLRDIERQLGSQKYARLRVGVGAAGGDLISHVLGEFDQQEQSVLPHVLQHVAERCEHWIVEDDIQKVIEKANTKPSVSN